MPNTFITVKEVARQALPRLIENLVFPNLVNRDYSADFQSGKGNKVLVRKPVVYKADEFSGSTAVQDITEASVEVTLDKIADVSIEFSAIEGATNIDSLNRIFVEPAAAAIAQKINSDGLMLYKDIANACGSGKTPEGIADIANVRKALNIAKVPVAGRRAVWDPEADAAFSAVPAIVNAEKSGSTAALREGSIGRIMGLDNFMSQAVCKHETGITAASAVKINGAVSAGASVISIDGTTLAGKLVKGDIITVDGHSYTITEDTAAAASNAIANIKIYPCVPENIADNADVTLAGSHTANLAFNPAAFSFVTRPLASPSGVESYTTSYNGISLRVTKGYDMTTKKEMLSMDVLYGYVTTYPELAVRVMG